MPTGTFVAGAIMKWRSVAKYPSTSGIYHVMIKLANGYGIPAGYGNWGFINVNCLSSLPCFTAV
jgi:hypothetical protein